MHVLGGAHRHVVFLEKPLVGDDIFPHLFARHAPGEIRVGTKGLLVHKIAPSPNSLAHEEPDTRQVQDVQNMDFLYLAHNEHGDERRNDAAIDGETTVVDAPDLPGMVPVIVPREQHIVGPCPDDAEDGTPDDLIKEDIEADALLLAEPRAEQQRQQKAARNNDAIPADGELRVSYVEVRCGGRHAQHVMDALKLDICVVGHISLLLWAE